MIRILGEGDQAALVSFLETDAAHTMFLRANLRRAGIKDTGAIYSGTYFATFADGAMVAVAAHYWNGNMVVAGPAAAVVPAAVAAVAASGRNVQGLVGAWEPVIAVEAALGLASAPWVLRSREDLFRLALDALRVPARLADGSWTCRLPRRDELPLLASWRADYSVEALNASPGPELDEAGRASIAATPEGDLWVLACDDRLVATNTFNARLPDSVQIGGVYTPPSDRGRGYGRAVVAGSLLAARDQGVSSAILFTGDSNVAARNAYLGIGFEIIGDYGLVLYQ